MEQEPSQAELQRQVREYIEALKPEWHAALAGFEREKASSHDAARLEGDARRDGSAG